MDRSDIDQIRSIFHAVQFNKTSHKRYSDAMQEIYNKYSLNEFFDEFSSCLIIPLRHNEKESHVQNVLEFAANFVINQQAVIDDDSDEMCPFILELFNWLLKYHKVKDLTLRCGICTFINTLLNAMGTNSYINEELGNKITTEMSERLQDRSPRVRTQAILALYRLQDPTDKDCPVIKLFIDHLLRDPSAEVRKTILNYMAKTQQTLHTVLLKIKDVDDDLRKSAYNFISKIKVKSLTIEQRDMILNSGLNDCSEKVRQFVKTTLIPKWLNNYKDDYIKLLKGLDVENAVDLASSCLEILLNNADVTSVIEQIPIDETDGIIPLEKLTSENVLLWRYFVKHLKEIHLTEYVDRMLPELSQFCNYVRKFMSTINENDTDSWEAESQRFILLQLFKMSELYELSDEAGRLNLRKLMTDTLVSKYIHFGDISQTIIKYIVDRMEYIIPNVEGRITILTNVICELRMPSEQQTQPEQNDVTESQTTEMKIKKAQLRVELIQKTEEQYQALQTKSFIRAEELKNEITLIEEEIKKIAQLESAPVVEDENNDEVCVEEKTDVETLWKCLTIISTMLQANSIKTLTTTIKTVVENIAISNIMHKNVVICSLALKTLGICSLLDGEMAKKFFFTFVLYLSNNEPNEEIFKTCLMAITDMFIHYGLKYFDADEDLQNDKQKKNKTIKLFDMEKDTDQIEDIIQEVEKESEDIITRFIKLMDHANEDYQYLATEGLCKLLLAGRISSSNLLSHLIIVLFNPVTERNSSLRRLLIAFFNNYVNVVSDGQEMLEEAFIPTLRTLENAPETSPLQQIDALKVAEMIIGFTSINAKKHGENHLIHNNLAFKIIKEIIENASLIGLDILVKSLKFLNVDFDYAETQLIQAELKEAELVVSEEDKTLVKYLRQFYDKLKGAEEINDNKKEIANEKDEVNEEEE